MKFHYFMGVFALGLGCSSNGLDDSEKLTSLTTAQTQQLCTELEADEPVKTVTCSGQQETIGVSGSDCEGSAGATNVPPGCTATVGQFLDCLNTIYGDPCGSNSTADSAACAPLQGCVGSD